MSIMQSTKIQLADLHGFQRFIYICVVCKVSFVPSVNINTFEKPTDVYVLRARAALTDFSKRHRALRDLERLIELDPANRALYQAEIRRWGSQERAWEKQAEPRYEAIRQQWAEQDRQEKEREARRLQLILEKRRKKKP